MFQIRKPYLLLNFILELPYIRIRTVLFRKAIEHFCFEITGLEFRIFGYGFTIMLSLDWLYWKHLYYKWKEERKLKKEKKNGNRH